VVVGIGLGASGCLQPLGDLTGSIPDSPADPVCVWNGAYAETVAPDTVAAMRDGARDCHVLVDPFDADDGPSVREAIGPLQDAGNTVVCYVSVGTCEDWRDDFDVLAPHCASEAWSAWPGEYFVADPERVAPIMRARMDRAAAWGCDRVEFDNMDFASEAERYALPVTPAEADAYVGELCDHVRGLGMGCMAKNGRPGGVDGFTAGTFESYGTALDWWSHDALQSFVDAGQPALIMHYADRRCDDVTRWYRLRYGAGVSVLCEDPRTGTYRHGPDGSGP